MVVNGSVREMSSRREISVESSEINDFPNFPKTFPVSL